jgi:hypothetical protein
MSEHPQDATSRAARRQARAVRERARRRPSGPPRTMTKLVERLTVLAFAMFVLAAVVGLAFGAGYVIGKLLL